MKLHEIIENLNNPNQAILIEKIIPYKKSLLIYFSNDFCCEPILMVTTVLNACQYAQIVPFNDFFESVNDWVKSIKLETEEDKENEIELINFQSIFLKDL